VKEAPYSGTLVICRLHILKPLLDTQNRRGYLTVVLFTNQELHMLLFTPVYLQYYYYIWRQQQHLTSSFLIMHFH